ncbi:response regulator [Litorihabitans aurantiacus]|uniref:Response regulator n=1 Tax=Litorihabitans aurantiacus TaxID=1930061 RepID=A0AA37UGN7_9MICO|nr:response regulator [Litorihabitans aurantiacus]GMA30024.1 response regulator [Litorihabitans aurantiacus]GMA33470.1 response regulator [Litorihabitans aurantiacus]
MTDTRGHVMVVDDDDSIREVATLALELVGGWRVTTAGDGPAAIDAVRDARPDVVLLDVMMPGMDGITTLARLREVPGAAEVPVVLMTAKAATGEEPEWQGLDILGVIAKPFDPMTLAARVAELLDARGADR